MVTLGYLSYRFGQYIRVSKGYYFGKPTPAFRTHLNVLSTDMKVLGFWSPWGLGYGRSKFKIFFR